MSPIRTTTAAALSTALLAAGLSLVTATSVQAVPTTCQGKPVTVVGNGTEGDDVFVVDAVPGVMSYDGKGGNDLICIRSGLQDQIYSITVHAGPGDDTVVNEVTDDDVWVITVLGAGSDTYLGLDRTIPGSPRATPFDETVFAGERDLSRPWEGEMIDTEPDTIDTRGGDDAVWSGSSTPGTINGDTVHTGPGADHLYWSGEQTGVVDMGTGVNSLEVHPGWTGNAVAFDTGTQMATTDGRPVLQWSGDVRRYTLLLDNHDVSFVGSDVDETLTMESPDNPTSAAASTRHRSASMGAGDDVLGVWLVGTGTVDGGPGRDSFSSSGCAWAEVRFGDSFRCTPSSGAATTYTFGFDRWEDLFVGGGDVTVVGSPRAEKIKVLATRIRLRGLGGDDVLNANRGASSTSSEPAVVVSGGAGDDRVVGSYAKDRLLGGRGDDKLFGDDRNDTILGGPGRDRAFGQQGRDRCVAEIRRSCERD